MKAAVITFPGSNRERDMCLALQAATGAWPELVWHGDTDLPDVDLIVIPGGFAYGDYLRAGAMAAHSPIIREVMARAGHGIPVLGVCNGFQVLTETGLLPGALMRNGGLKFVCKDVHLKVANAETIFTTGYRHGEVLRVPVAHHDGNYFADDATLAQLEEGRRIVFYYCDAEGSETAAANPNGSRHNIAGLINDRGNVLGMMPHPENATDALFGGLGGAPLFGALAALAA